MSSGHERTALRVTTIRFSVILDEDLAIGGTAGVGDEDRPVITDGLARSLIPGTSLAGVLRQETRDHFGTATADALFGDPESEGGRGRIEVDDIVLIAETVMRDGVGIDRFSGAAAPQVLYNLEVVPAGAGGTGEIRLLSSDVALHDRFVDLVSVVTAGGLRLGSGVTRGRGSVSIDGCVVTTRVLADRIALLAALGIAGDEAARRASVAVAIGDWVRLSSDPEDDTAGRTPSHATVIEVTAPFTTTTPVFTASGDRTDVFATIPLTTVVRHPDGPRRHLVLPGSSVKGALRTHAERIERTVRGVGLEGPARDGRDFLAQLTSGGTPISALLFGAALDRGADGNRDGMRSLLAVRSARSQWSCSAEDWDRIVNAPKASDVDTLASVRPLLVDASVAPGESDAGVLRAGTHNAIDRWSGRVSDGMLFTVLEPHAVTWDPLRFTLRFPADSPADVATPRQIDAAVFLLLLILRDLAAGDIPLGWGGNRGYGGVAMHPSEVTVDGLDLERGGEGRSLSSLLNQPDSAERFAAAWRAEVAPHADSRGEVDDAP